MKKIEDLGEKGDNDMEIKIDLSGLTLDEAVLTLLNSSHSGKKVYGIFNGEILHSEGLSFDSAYKQVLGVTRAEYQEQQKKWLEEYRKEQAELKLRKIEYEKLIASRATEESRKVTKEKVVAGLKFITEHQDLEQLELINGLLDLGCAFTFDDIRKQLPVSVGPFEGMKIGDIASGACVIANVRNSEDGRCYCDDRFFSIDDEESAYNFIRVVTGDETYTKAKVDAMKKQKVLSKKRGI